MHVVVLFCVVDTLVSQVDVQIVVLFVDTNVSQVVEHDVVLVIVDVSQEVEILVSTLVVHVVVDVSLINVKVLHIDVQV